MLHRLILVGAVLVVMQFTAEGAYLPAIGIAIPLAVVAYFRITDAGLLR